MANKVKEKAVEPVETEVKAEVAEHEDFISRKLKAVNRMMKPAKAERVAHRLLMKARDN